MRTVFLLVFCTGAGLVPVGLNEYRAGHFEAAYRSWTEASESDGESVALHHNRALAAIGAGLVDEAEIAAEKTVVLGGSSHAAWRDFVHGNCSFLRCERAEVLSARPEAGMPEFDAAIYHAELARDYWIKAGLSRDDWPEARRNVERALLKLNRLRTNRTEAKERLQKKSRQRTEKERPKPPPRTKIEERRNRAVATELPDAQLKRLLDKLVLKQREKRRLRLDEREARRTQGERDW